MSNLYISPGTRAQYRPGSDALNISMDFNASPSGTARGTEVIIPDNAPPEVRAAAEQYNQMVAEFARANGIADYPVRGVRTRSENGRGVPNTVHVEPFFNTDMDMQRAIQANPQAFAEIYRTAFGGLPNARLIAPHGVGRDRGAASEIFQDETTFGELMANSLLGQEYTMPPAGANPFAAPQGTTAQASRTAPAGGGGRNALAGGPLMMEGGTVRGDNALAAALQRQEADQMNALAMAQPQGSASIPMMDTRPAPFQPIEYRQTQNIPVEFRPRSVRRQA